MTRRHKIRQAVAGVAIGAALAAGAWGVGKALPADLAPLPGPPHAYQEAPR